FGRGPRALGREGADVHLVDDLSRDPHPAPATVAPAVRSRVDELRGARRTRRLPARPRIGHVDRAVEQVAVALARAQVFGETREPTVRIGLELVAPRAEEQRDALA